MILCIVRRRRARGRPLRRFGLPKVCLSQGGMSLLFLPRRQKLPYDINAHDDEGLLQKNLQKQQKAR